MRALTLGERIRGILRNGSLPATELVDAVLVEIAKSRDFKKIERVRKEHGSKIQADIRRLMERGDIRPGKNLNLELAAPANI